MIDLTWYCGRCGIKQLSKLNLQRDPFQHVSRISIANNEQIIDPKNPENVIRSSKIENYTQDPALICDGCFADLTETPTADPIWVGGKRD